MADFSFDENVAEQTAFALADLGHDILTAREARTKGIDDARQLALAVRLGRIFVTHNRTDFLLLHRAWRIWTHDWGVSSRARHPGILVVPQPPLLATTAAARLLDEFAHGDDAIANRLFAWTETTGWRPLG